MIAINLVGTKKNSGTKTFNINILKQLNLNIDEDIIVYISKSYLDNLDKDFSKKIKFKIKSDILENFIIRFIWMYFFLPLDLKLNNVKVLFSTTNYSSYLLKFFNIKSILFIHTVMPWAYFDLQPGSLLKKIFIKKTMESSISISEKVIVPSEYAKKILIEKLYLESNKIVVVNLGADHMLTQFESDYRLNDFNYNDEYILSVLSCVRYHNVINLLQAYKIFLNEKKSNMKFVIVLTILDQKYFDEIKNFISSNFKKNQILILPNLEIDYLNNIYKNSSIYIFSSYSETFGFSSLEAMNFNIPLIISQTSALKEINGNIPEYFNPDNIEEIKSKLIKVYENMNNKKEILERLNLNKNILKKYLWKNTFLECYKILKKNS